MILPITVEEDHNKTLMSTLDFTERNKGIWEGCKKT